MKNGKLSIATLVLIIVALFIPTYIAIASFMAGPSEEYTKKQKELVSVTVTDSDGKQYSYEKGDGETSAKMLSVFKSIFADSQRLSSTLSSAVRSQPAYSVKATTVSGEQSYIFYFSVKGASYYEDSKGTAYGISNDSATEFLKTECAMALYYKTPAPVLKTAFGSEIIASEMSWLYLGHSGNYLPTDTKTTTETVEYTLDSFSFSFDNKPDNAKVTILADDEPVYSGTLENMSTIGEMKKNVTYKFEISAEWFKDAERNYCGSARYIFTSRINEDPAEFNLSETSLEAGQAGVINAYNITDPSHIKVVFTPALNYNGEAVTPVFHGADGKYSAMFTIPQSCFADNAQTGKTMKYVIEVSYGSTKYELNLDVSARTVPAKATEGNTKKADVTKLRTEEALANFAALRKEYAQKTSNEKLWKTEKFYNYYSNTTKYALSFGKHWKLSTGVEYANEFVQYKMKNGTEIVAVNDGKVIAVGENEFLGKYIVIDHGLGLQTWYLHLSAVSVEVGADVAYKQAIGKSGSTGFIEDSSVGFALLYTVNGVPTCPYAQNSGKGLEETGIKIGAYAQ